MAESETQHAMTLRAAEYVLGTLDAEDARAFERELSNDAGMGNGIQRCTRSTVKTCPGQVPSWKIGTSRSWGD